MPLTSCIPVQIFQRPRQSFHLARFHQLTCCCHDLPRVDGCVDGDFCRHLPTEANNIISRRRQEVQPFSLSPVCFKSLQGGYRPRTSLAIAFVYA